MSYLSSNHHQTDRQPANAAIELPMRIESASEATDTDNIEMATEKRLRMDAISREFGLDQDFTPVYLRGKNLANRFVALTNRVRRYKDVPGTSYDPASGTYEMKRLFARNIPVTDMEDGYENVYLSLSLGFSHRVPSRIKLQWFTDKNKIEDCWDEDTENYELDPICIERTNFYSQSTKTDEEKALLTRMLNYAAQVLEVYNRAFSDEQEAKRPPKRAARVTRKKDEIDIAVDGMLAALSPE